MMPAYAAQTETSGVVVRIYRQEGEVITLDGHPASTSAVSQVNWTKTLGQAAGQFSVAIKTTDASLSDRLSDDDWVDISFTRFDQEYLVCRGLIDTIQEQVDVRSGATAKTLVIRGRDHGKIWARHTVYFNRFGVKPEDSRLAMLKAFDKTATKPIFGDVSKVVNTILIGLLKEEDDKSVPTIWKVPAAVPGSKADQGFVGYVKFNDWGYTNNPARNAIQAFQMDVQGADLWSLAQQWSDPHFCELYTELVKEDGDIPDASEALSAASARPAVVLRDRPFLQGDDLSASDYFSLPRTDVVPQDIQSGMSLSRGGEERFNAYFVRGKPVADIGGNIDLEAPLVDIEDIKKHGFRRFNVESQYSADPDLSQGEAVWSDHVKILRARARDFHCLNPQFFSGVIPLARGFPGLRIGTRLRIKSPLSEDDNLSFYVEGISHSWSLGPGMKTTATVSRGWRGTDNDLINALREARRFYELAGGKS